MTEESFEKSVINVGGGNIFRYGALKDPMIRKIRYTILKDCDKYTLCGSKDSVISLCQFCSPFFSSTNSE